MLPDEAPDTESNFIFSSSNAFNAPICAAAFIPPPDMLDLSYSSSQSNNLYLLYESPLKLL